MPAGSTVVWRIDAPETIHLPGEPMALTAGPSQSVLPDMFQRIADAHSQRTAIECRSNRLTYAALEAESNRWAWWLRRHGIGRGMRVALRLGRSIDAHLVLLGILKSGAAYVPIDPESPAERVRFIMKDSGASALVTSTLLLAVADLDDASQTRETVGETIDRPPCLFVVEHLRTSIADESAAALGCDETALTPDDEAYVIYTSGSTGRPKGVSISHRSACHLALTEADFFRVSPNDRVFQGFSLAFDASVEEIWLAYCAGATLVVGDLETIHSGPDLAVWMGDARITILSCVPTLLLMMEEVVPCVRTLIVGGEACPPHLVERWAGDGRRMWNSYGPTEATVVATCGELLPGRPVTIGRPLIGYRAAIVDDRLLPVRPEVPGELLLGGVGLSRGYVGLPELTREKFVHIPSEASENGDDRWYRTGDLCRFNPEGEIEFLGRIDGQVKLRGYRIEPSEIEAVLIEHGGVRTAAVTVREDVPGVKHLVAYIVPRDAHPGSRTSGDCCPQLEAELRAFARERLPAYMVPAVIETLSDLPTLASGKVDRAALPAPRIRAVTPSHVESAVGVEAAVLEVWTRLFAPAPVAVSDNFFLDLGGDSLTAAGMISELRRRREFRSASMADIYRRQTLRDFAAPFDATIAAAGSEESNGSEACDDLSSRIPGSGSEKRTGLVADDETLAPQTPTSSLKFAMCGAAQLPALYFMTGLSGLQWLAPFMAYSWLQDSDWTVLESVAGSVAALVLMFPMMIALAIALKWILLGRVRPGSYRLWGWFYWRWWCVQTFEAVIPLGYLVGTPLLNLYCRLMGARIGAAVHLGCDDFGAYDLIRIGEGTAIGADSSLLGYNVSDGMLHLGPISVGRECVIGSRSFLEPGTRMEDGARLDDLSMLPSGSVIARGETWRGSPAVRAETGRTVPDDLSRRHGTWGRRFWFAAAQIPGVLLVPLLIVGAILPGMAIMHHLNDADDAYWYLLLTPAVGLSFVMILGFQILVVKWLVMGRARPATYPLHGLFSLRKWYVDRLLDLSLDIVGTLYSTLYLAPWYRALGARLGRFAEISTASFISPDLLDLDDGSFIADMVSLGAARVEDGTVTVDRVRVGKRSFVGNSALVPPGSELGDDCLIGCLSLPPEPQGRPVANDTSWLGSPAMELPRRAVNTSFHPETTFAPTPWLVTLRLFIELWRVVLPPAGFLCVASLMFSSVSILRDEVDEWEVWLAFPVLYAASCLVICGIVVALKWLLMGRYRPLERPLWSGFVWRTELVTGLHDYLAGPLLLNMLRGTPFLAWYFRLMGTNVGQRVYFDTIQITEFDLVTIGDDVALDSDVTLQTHLFEDRVMKMSHVCVGPGCVAGAESLILYDTQMNAGSRLGSLSLLMKGEVLQSGTRWQGVPPQPHISPCLQDVLGTQQHSPCFGSTTDVALESATEVVGYSSQ